MLRGRIRVQQCSELGSCATLYVSGTIICTRGHTAYSQMSCQSARVAASIGGTTAQTQSRAVSLNVAETLAVVTLLG